MRNVAEAKHPPTDPQSEGSDTDSPTRRSKERSPRYAQPVPGGAKLPEAETEEAAEEEDTVAEPTYAFAQGFGRFVIRYTRLATALGNFEQGSIQTESAAVAHWLTSGRVEPALSPIWTDKAPGGVTQTLLLPRLPPITRRRSPIPPIWSDSIHRGPLGRAS